MNNFYGTQLGNHSRPFTIRHKELRTALLSGYSTLTSVPVCKETSLSRKQCMLQMKFLLISFRKMLFPTKFRLRELLKAPSSGGKKMTSFVFCNKIPLSRKWSVIEVEVVINTIWQLAFGIQTESWLLRQLKIS